MDNMLKNAHFGDMFRLKDGREIVYLKRENDTYPPNLMIFEDVKTAHFNDDGISGWNNDINKNIEIIEKIK